MTKMTADHNLRVYELAVEMADRVSARRGTSNQFYLTIETLLLGIPAGLASFGRAVIHPLLVTSVLAVGVAIALLWWLQLRAYRALNREKFIVIQRIEREHLELHPYTDEWGPLKSGEKRKWRERYQELGALERTVPWVFVVFEIVVGVIVWL